MSRFDPITDPGAPGRLLPQSLKLTT